MYRSLFSTIDVGGKTLIKPDYHGTLGVDTSAGRRRP